VVRMVYELNWTDQTIGTFYRQIGNVTGIFEILLFFEFMIIILVGSVANKKSTGVSNVITWALVSSFVVTISATALAIGNFIEIPTLIIWIMGTLVILIVDFLGGKIMGSNDTIV
jgi:hypothetical protein